MTYLEFLKTKVEVAPVSGFAVDPGWLSPVLKPHQRDAVRWAVAGGRRALFESLGLGKTLQELEYCRLALRHEGGKALIVLPLGVRQEFKRDAVQLLGMEEPQYITSPTEATEDGKIYLTNYERVRDGDIDPKGFTVCVLDEAAVLRSFGSKTYQTFLPKFKGVKYKLVATATPAPNRLKEQIDAHGFWRSSGDRLMTKEEIENTPVDRLQAVYRQYSRDSVYSYAEHVEIAKKLDADGHLPATFMVVAPGSWSEEVWDDVNRMRTLNTSQSQRRQQMHVCPLQFDIVDRLINRYSNEGDLIFDPFGGIGTTPLRAMMAGRRGLMTELNPDYFRDAVGYLDAEEAKIDTPTLFDYLGIEA